MPTNLERASLVSRSVQIESVTLAGLAMNADVGEQSDDALLRLSQRYRARYDPRESDSSRLFVRVDLRFEAHSGSDVRPERHIADIKAEFLVVYRTTTTSGFPADALRHFAELNGTYNAWPYWRELVQSMTTRAGISGVTVPVFRPRVRTVEVQESLPIAGRTDVVAAPRAAARGRERLEPASAEQEPLPP